YSAAALGTADVGKLVRTLMIMPISVTLAAVEHRPDTDSAPLTAGRIVRLIPWFLTGFPVVALITSTGIIPEDLADALRQISVHLIAAPSAGIGMTTDLGAIRRTGLRPLALGGVLSVLVAATTLGVMALTVQS